MEQVIKKFKLIGGAAILTCCLLPFIKIGAWGFYLSANGFQLFNLGFLGTLSLLLILSGAAGLIFVDIAKKDINLGPKFTLSFLAKLAALAGGATVLLLILFTDFVGVGFGLILEILIAGSLLFEDKIVAAITKKGCEKQE